MTTTKKYGMIREKIKRNGLNMAKKRTKYLPIQLVEKYERLFPNCWESIEEKRKNATWNMDMCYIPQDMCRDLVVMRPELTNNDITLKSGYRVHTANPAAVMAGLAPWRQFKEVYSFSPELETLLYEQADDIEIPVDIFCGLPFPCIYLETQCVKNLHGVFVYINEMEDGAEELRVNLLFNSLDVMPIYLPLYRGITIRQAIGTVFNEARELLADEMDDDLAERLEAEEKWCKQFMAAFLQLLIYICCQNADIQEDPIQKTIMKRTEKVTDTYKEVRKWAVGETIAKTVRRNKAQKNTALPRTTTDKVRQRPRPHTRRGHWHHFWTGKRDTDNRKLIVRWVAPTYINIVTDDGEIQDTALRKTTFTE